MNKATPSRAGDLDSLRAFAVLAVIFSHTIPESFFIGKYFFFEFGAYGVYIFFVISGFLITGQLIETKKVHEARGDSIGLPLKSFFAKRALRLLPAYYLALLAAWIIDLGTIRAEMPWHMAQLTNILFGLDSHAEDFSPVGHLWSLSMEWQFYIVWPFIILLCRQKMLLPITLLFISISFAADLEILPLPKPFLASSILQSLDSLGFGALLAIAHDRKWQIEPIARWFWVAGLAFVVLILPYATGDLEIAEALEPYAHESMNLFFVLVVHRAYTGWNGPFGYVLSLPALRYTGVISYGIYLYHQYILSAYEGLSHRLWESMPVDYGLKLTFLLFAVSWVTAHFSWVWFEEPINRMRQRYSYPAKDRSSRHSQSDANAV